MAELLKNAYTKKYLISVGESLADNDSNFNIKTFIEEVMGRGWKEMELKERMRRITHSMHLCLPKEYKKALNIIIKAAKGFGGFEGMFFPDFVEVFGQEKKYRKESLAALKVMTMYSSSEFAIRPFIQSDLAQTMRVLLLWSKDKNEHVRRLASEGCRPLLPWGMNLVALKKDPTLILPILENLKSDESLYVRRSVANNLNDISKGHPQLVIKIAKKWFGKNEKTDWLVKHACRTLLKSGNLEVMKIFGYGNSENFKIRKFDLKDQKVAITQSLEFSAEIDVKKESKIRIEYALYFLRKNDTYTKKVFKVSEKNIAKGKLSIIKKHSFKLISTRKYYPGSHEIGLVINGVEGKRTSFELVEPYWVYMIETEKNKIYTGIALDPKKRFSEHKSGKKGAKFFRGNRPIKIVFQEIVGNRSQAQKREAQIKKLTKKEKLKLISKI